MKDFRCRENLALVITAVVFSSFGYFAAVLSKQMSIITTIFLIHLIELIFFLAYIALKRIRLFNSPRQLFYLLIFGILNTLPILCFNFAVSQEKIGIVLLIQNAVTLLVSVPIAYFLLKEKTNIKEIGLILIIILGIVNIYQPLSGLKFFGLFFTINTGFWNAVVNLLRRKFSQNISPFTLGFFSSLSGSILYGGITVFSGTNAIITFSPQIMILLFVYAALNVLTTLLLIVGFKGSNFTLGNIILTLEIPLGFIFGFLLLRQEVISYQLIGSLTIIISIILIRIIQWEKERSAPDL